MKTLLVAGLALILEWNAVPNATRYQIETAPCNGNRWRIAGFQPALPGVSRPAYRYVEGIDRHGQKFRVRAENPRGMSGPSADLCWRPR